jgi:hypothetical protein
MHNMFVHAFGAALMACDLRLLHAGAYLNAHEGGTASSVLTDELLRTNPIRYYEHAQDFWNNEVGMQIGVAMRGKSDAEVALAIWNAIKDGRLRAQDGANGLIRSDRVYAEWQRQHPCDPFGYPPC